MIGLALEKVSRAFAGAGRPVLNGVDLAVSPGEFVALIGPSGAGKTTLLRILAGLDRGFGGRVIWEGAAAPRIGMVFQEARLVPWLSVLDNLLLAAGNAARADALELLAVVELVGREQALPGQLSGGMQRRAALARALLVKPDLLLLDEPLISLDRACAARMRTFLARRWLADRPTVVMVTHDLAEAVELSSRIVALAPETGRVAFDRPVALPVPRSAEEPGAARLLGELRDLARDWPMPEAPAGERDSPEQVAKGSAPLASPAG